MAQVEWLMACDLAYFDREERLCMVGVTKHLLLPSLPVRLRGLTLVAQLTNVRPGERLTLGVIVSTPEGEWIKPSNPNSVQIEVNDRYILASLRDLPIDDEGKYRFALRLTPDELVAIDIPVFAMSPANQAECH